MGVKIDLNGREYKKMGANFPLSTRKKEKNCSEDAIHCRVGCKQAEFFLLYCILVINDWLCFDGNVISFSKRVGGVARLQTVGYIHRQRNTKIWMSNSDVEGSA